MNDSKTPSDDGQNDSAVSFEFDVKQESDLIGASSNDVAGLSPEDRHPVDILADEFSARWRAGESPSVDEYVRRAPEQESMIRSLFPTIAMIERMSRRSYADRKRNRPVLTEEKIIGDFRIVREVGRGGMGVVYEAVQRSLERRVALKVLGSGIAESPKQLERFRREAESVARLHHTNIVPVYGIGEESGIHFYAMQFIDGIPLADAIETVRHRTSHPHTSCLEHPSQTVGLNSASSGVQRSCEKSTNSAVNDPTVISPPMGAYLALDKLTERRRADVESPRIPAAAASTERVNAFLQFFANSHGRVYFQRIAELAAQIAGALEYAHQHGVLHRDIKPSNVMLDQSGSVWIMDFGLVKVLERQDLTQAGEIVGTLRYMAPEQLEGHAGITTDVYGLGLTLYELATLKPAFAGDEAVTLAQRLRQSEIPRPRSVNPSIPRDLETIILKATAREPAARYASAAKLAEDLHRFCEDRPILAKRSTVSQRLWRWSRRNPALAAATISTTMLLIMVAVIATVGRIRIESALLDSKASQRRAESNLDAAITAFDSILDNVTSRGLPRSLAFNIPQAEIGLTQTPLSAADALLLDRLLEFYRNFANQNADNISLRTRIADAHQRAGAILVRLGRLSEAEEDFRGAIALLDRVLKTDPHNAEALVKSAALYNEIGELQLRRGEFSQTFNSHLEARAILLAQPDLVRSLPAVRFELARSTDLFASIDVRSGINEGPTPPPAYGPGDNRPPGGAYRSFEKRPPPLDRHRGSDDSGPGDPGPGNRGPGSHGSEPPEHERDPRLTKALPSSLSDHVHPSDGLTLTLLEASNEFRSLAEEFPNQIEYQFRWAQCLRHRLVHAASNHQTDVASETFLSAIEILNRLITKFPDDPRFLFELADTLTQASRAQSEGDARIYLDRAVEIADQLSTRFPAASEYQLLLGTALQRRGAAAAATSDATRADESLSRSIRCLEHLARQFPDQGIIQIPLAKSCEQLGDLLRQTAPPGDAGVAQREQSRELLQTAVDRFEKYLGLSQSASPGAKGHFNAVTKSSLYQSLSETLSAQGKSDEAQFARQKAAREGRQTPPHRR